jgi:phenylacetate-CoA ligase
VSRLYETFFRRVAFPLYEGGIRRRSTLRYITAYERDQWLSPQRIAELQWQRLTALLDYCERHVPYYRRLWKSHGVAVADIRTLKDYERLPILTKHDIRENFEDLKAEPLREQILYKVTGGSTGEPLRFGYTRESNDRRTAVMWRGYAWAGARMGMKTLFLWGGAVGNPSKSHQLKDRIYQAAFARRMLNSFAMSETTFSDYADAIDRFRPEIIVAYVGPLVRLAQWLIESGRRIHRPQAILGAAEALHEFQRELIERAFGAPAFNTYGCREFMLMASECEHRNGLHVNADHLLLEVLNPAGTAVQDEPGEIAVTDLFNYGMPFIRYVNGDLGTTQVGTCACGRGLPLLRRVDGRKLDAIRTRDGRILPGEFFPHMLKDVRGVRRFQVVQRTLDRIDLSIVRSDGFDQSAVDYILRETAKVLGDKVTVNLVYVDAIPLGANGKFRVTLSELA